MHGMTEGVRFKGILERWHGAMMSTSEDMGR